MAILTLAWLLAQAAVPTPGDRMAAHLGAAEHAIARIELCAAEDPDRLEETHGLLAQRRERLDVAATELFGSERKGSFGAPVSGSGDCADGGVARLRATAEAELDEAQALVDSALGPERRQGLWLAELKVCDVQSAAAGVEVPMPELVVTLASGQTAALRRITEERQGGALPVWLDGKLLFAPMVREAITGGTVAIMGDPGALDAIGVAAKAPC